MQEPVAIEPSLSTLEKQPMPVGLNGPLLLVPEMTEGWAHCEEEAFPSDLGK